MARRRISSEKGLAALRSWQDNQRPAAETDRTTLATAARYLLEELAARAPGHAVEVRVPPFGVTQCVAGPRHSRGTPPNVVEFDVATWLGLATGAFSWTQAEQQGLIQASGSRADLSEYLPLVGSAG